MEDGLAPEAQAVFVERCPERYVPLDDLVDSVEQPLGDGLPGPDECQ